MFYKPPTYIVTLPHCHRFTLTLVTSCRTRHSPLQVKVLGRTALRVRSNTRRINLQTVRQHVLISRHSRTTHPNTRVVTLVRVGPALIHQGLLGSTDISNTLNPNGVGPFRTTRHDGRFFPDSLGRLNRVFTVFAVYQDLLKVVMFFIDGSMFLGRSNGVYYFVIDGPLQLFHRRVFNFLAQHGFGHVYRSTLVGRLRVLGWVELRGQF